MTRQFFLGTSSARRCDLATSAARSKRMPRFAEHTTFLICSSGSRAGSGAAAAERLIAVQWR